MNRMRRQQRLASILAAVSPLSAVSFAAMDLARTGMRDWANVQDALVAHLPRYASYVRGKRADLSPDLGDFVPFSYTPAEPLGDCLERNLRYLLILVLMALLGYAGAFVWFVRLNKASLSFTWPLV